MLCNEKPNSEKRNRKDIFCLISDRIKVDGFILKSFWYFTTNIHSFYAVSIERNTPIFVGNIFYSKKKKKKGKSDLGR